MHLKLSQLEKYIYNNAVLNRDELEEIEHHLLTCAMCRDLVEQEQLMYNVLKSKRISSTEVPFRLELQQMGIDRNDIPSRLVLAADSQSLSKPVYSSYVSKDYGFLIRINYDAQKSMLKASGLSANEDISLRYADINLPDVPIRFSLNSKNKANVSLSSSQQQVNIHDTKLEIIFPLAVFEMKENEPRYKTEQYEIELIERDQEATLKWRKTQPYLPNIMLMQLFLRDNSSVRLKLQKENVILPVPISSIKRMAVYSG